MPKVFIGMPVYNGERFIKEAIDSLLSQSFSDFALFISDDSSTDGTGNICREYAKKDTRVQYYRQEKNFGMFANFKFVMDKAGAEYFMWAAQDDIREKNYLKVCVEHLEKDKELGLATTVMSAVDSYGRSVSEDTELIHFSKKPKLINVVCYVLQPEILGKCNLMYGLFRTDVVKAVWQAYPQRQVWGQDYMFSLALISRFKIYVDKRILFKKRYGGFSSPNSLINDRKEGVNRIQFKNPKNIMFPFGRFKNYFWGHMEALRGTFYQPMAAILLMARLPRSLIIHLKERNFKKYIDILINR